MTRREVEELQSERAWVRAVIEQAPAIISVFRGPDLIVEFVSDLWRQAVGPREMLGKPYREAFPEFAEQGFADTFERIFCTGEPETGHEVRADIDNADGVREERYFNYVWQPMRGADGEITGVITHSVDVTERVSPVPDGFWTDSVLIEEAPAEAPAAEEEIPEDLDSFFPEPTQPGVPPPQGSEDSQTRVPTNLRPPSALAQGSSVQSIPPLIVKAAEPEPELEEDDLSRTPLPAAFLPKPVSRKEGRKPASAESFDTRRWGLVFLLMVVTGLSFLVTSINTGPSADSPSRKCQFACQEQFDVAEQLGKLGGRTHMDYMSECAQTCLRPTDGQVAAQ